MKISKEWIEFYRRHRPSLTELRALIEWAEAERPLNVFALYLGADCAIL